MGIGKSFQTHYANAGRMDHVQQLTDASTGTAVKNYGITSIVNASTDDKTYSFGSAPRLGMRKTLIIDALSTGSVIIGQASTAITFHGSTYGTMTFSTGATAKACEMVGMSATSWAVTSQTTGLVLS